MVRFYLKWHRRNTNRSCYARFLLSRNSKNHQKRFCYAPLRTTFCRFCVLRTAAHDFLPILRVTHKIFFPYEQGPATALCHLKMMNLNRYIILKEKISNSDVRFKTYQMARLPLKSPVTIYNYNFFTYNYI